MKIHMKGLALAAAMMTMSTTMFAADTASADKKFVEESGKGSLAEVEMGKLALKNSTNKDVRMFAAKMVKDHTMLIEQMKPFADKMGVAAPTSMASSEQDEYDRLAKKTGESFDKDYIQTMVDDHHKDLKEFTEEASSTDNAALKAAVTKGRGVIQQHTLMIDGLGHKYSLNVPMKN